MSNEFLIKPLSFYDHIKTKDKVLYIDIHNFLPWLLICDKSNTITILDIQNHSVIRAFSLSEYIPEDLRVIGAKFVMSNNMFNMNNNNDNKENEGKQRGIPKGIRNSLIYITTDRYVFFYSYILQNFIRLIPSKDLNDHNIIKAEVYNYLYILILTDDGNLNIWNMRDWRLSRILTKSELGKKLVNFYIFSINKSDKFVIGTSKSGYILKILLNYKEICVNSIDNGRHDKEINSIDYGNIGNILVSVSKNYIIFHDINNKDHIKKVSNFQINEGEKAYKGIINNTSSFNENSIILFGKGPKIVIFETDLKDNSKIDSKNAQKYVHYTIDLSKEIFTKITDGIIKVYDIKITCFPEEFLIIASNKGVIIEKYSRKMNNITKINPCIISKQKKNLEDFYFYLINKNFILEKKISISNNFNDKIRNYEIKINENCLKREVFKQQKAYSDYEINFNYDYSYLSCLDSNANSYIIYKIEYKMGLISNLTEFKSGQAIDLKWCPYDNILALCHIQGNNNYSIEVINLFSSSPMYTLSDIIHPHIYSGPFIVLISKGRANSANNNSSIESELRFVGWEAPGFVNINLVNEVIFACSGNDLGYTVVGYKDKFDVFKLNPSTESITRILTYHFHILDGIIYENFIFVFSTYTGIYFIVLSANNPRPIKLLSQSTSYLFLNSKIVKYENNNFNSKRIIENNQYYDNFIFDNKNNSQRISISDPSIQSIQTLPSLHSQSLPLQSQQQSKSQLQSIQNIPIETQDNINNSSYNCFHTRILGIIGTRILTSDLRGFLGTSEIRNIIFIIIELVKEKKFEEIKELMQTVDKRSIKNILGIFDYYFENNEMLLRKIFDDEMIQKLELHNYYPFFIKSINKDNKEKLENIMKNNLIQGIMEVNEKKIYDIYTMSSGSNLKLSTKAARFIDKETYLNSLIEKNKYVEAYLFNKIHKINNQGENLLTNALDKLNTKGL